MLCSRYCSGYLWWGKFCCLLKWSPCQGFIRRVLNEYVGNYEYVIESLVKKPRALCFSQWLDEYGLIEAGLRVKFSYATALVQHPQQAKQKFKLEDALLKLDKYAVLILDDIGYVRKTEQETSVMFNLIAHRVRTLQYDHHIKSVA